MGLKIYKFREMDELTYFLNGAVIGPDISWFAQSIKSGGGGTKDAPVLATKTFKTKAPGPAGTCTFVAGADAAGRLTPKEIKTQIEAAIANVKVYFLSGRIVIQETTPTNGITIDKTGTANSALGFDIAEDMVAKVYKSPFHATPPVAPYFIDSYSVNDNMHVIVVME